jgi:hypothetical protein
MAEELTPSDAGFLLGGFALVGSYLVALVWFGQLARPFLLSVEALVESVSLPQLSLLAVSFLLAVSGVSLVGLALSFRGAEWPTIVHGDFGAIIVSGCFLLSSFGFYAYRSGMLVGLYLIFLGAAHLSAYLLYDRVVIAGGVDQ